jgi:eukaryotic-like serine/threonine-protein kinase
MPEPRPDWSATLPDGGLTAPPATTLPNADAPVAPSQTFLTGAGRPPSAGRAVPPAAAPDGYEILDKLGQGGMGVVYKARQVRAGRLVALKMILSGSHAGDAERARFRTEAEAVACLQHPNVVQVYEVGEHDGKPFFSLEFCPGGSLDRRLKGSPLRPEEAARLVEALARGAHAAHRKGVVHRDLKPANVLLAEDGTPKITDFGLAKKIDDHGQTHSGVVMGTPSYMAPEQASGMTHQVGPATDVYSLGAVLYDCLTGRPPFKAASLMDTLAHVLYDEPVRPAQLQPKVPRDLETICLKCLRKEPARRYASALDLAEDLRRFLDGEPIAARPAGPAERAWRWCRRHPSAASLMALVGLSLVLGAGVASFFAYEADRRARSDAEARAVAEAEGRLARAEHAEALAQHREAERQRAEAEAQLRLAHAELRRARGPLLSVRVSGVGVPAPRDEDAGLPGPTLRLTLIPGGVLLAFSPDGRTPSGGVGVTIQLRDGGRWRRP